MRKHDRIDIEILDLMLIKPPSHCSNRAESILYAARETSGYHALIVHSDADDRDYKQTRKELFDPGVALIQQEQADVCRDLIPIIPVRMVEAWMLADPEALQRVLKTTVQVLGLPGKAQLVERDSNPKDTLKFIIQRVYPHQSRYWNRIRGELYGRLAPEMSLDRLRQVASYKQFLDDLTATLKILNLIQ